QARVCFAAFAATANCNRSCCVGGSNAALGSPATSARTVARRRAALPDLRLSFATHLRYNEPDPADRYIKRYFLSGLCGSAPPEPPPPGRCSASAPTLTLHRYMIAVQTYKSIGCKTIVEKACM